MNSKPEYSWNTDQVGVKHQSIIMIRNLSTSKRDGVGSYFIFC